MQEASLQMQSWWFFTFFKATWLSENKKINRFHNTGHNLHILLFAYSCFRIKGANLCCAIFIGGSNVNQGNYLWLQEFKGTLMQV